MTEKKRSPWSWIPTLYFAEGLPNVAVVTISVIMYKRMGISNADIALYTSWLYIPWLIKPFWSPFIELLKTKRWWIVIMQLFIGACFAGIAFTIPLPFFFQATLAFFWLLAFSSATHDIAADGFYMLALDSSKQAMFVGIRSTFYRFAMITGQGLLVILAGFLEISSGKAPLNIQVEVSPQYTYSNLFVPLMADFPPEEGDVRFIVDKSVVQIGTMPEDKDSIQLFLKSIAGLNRENGFVPLEESGNKDKNALQQWWTNNVSEPTGSWIKNTFGEDKNVAVSGFNGNVGVVAVRLSRQPDNEDDIVLTTTMNKGDESISLIHGERLTFNRNNWNKPAYVVFQANPNLTVDSAASYKGLSGNISFAWSVTFFVLAGFFVLFALYHRFILPKPDADASRTNMTASTVWQDFRQTFISFFQKPQAAAAIFFMLTFRFSEAQLLKLINPFLLDSKSVGGLSLTTGEVGFVYGTIGIVGLVIGGIIGGIVASRGGLKKWLWPMTLSMLLTSATFLYLAYFPTDNLWIINTCIFIEQFGYGFGFTAYMLYLMYYSDGEHKTAHYAICTGFMALGMMLPGMFSGWLQEILGYRHFFIWIMICSVIPIIAVSLLKIDPDYGKMKKKNS